MPSHLKCYKFCNRFQLNILSILIDWKGNIRQYSSVHGAVAFSSKFAILYCKPMEKVFSVT